MNFNLRCTAFSGTLPGEMEEKGGGCVRVGLCGTNVRPFLGVICIIGRKLLKHLWTEV